MSFFFRLSVKEGLDLASDPSYNLGGLGKKKATSMRAFLLDTFAQVVINTQDDATAFDVDLTKRIVSFFVDHYDQVWVPPTELRKEVEERVRDRPELNLVYDFSKLRLLGSFTSFIQLQTKARR